MVKEFAGEAGKVVFEAVMDGVGDGFEAFFLFPFYGPLL